MPPVLLDLSPTALPNGSGLIPAKGDASGQAFVTSTQFFGSTSQGTLGALNAAQTTPCNGAGSVGVQVSGSFSATLAFEATIDGVNWFAVYGWVPGSATPATTATAAGEWSCAVTGFTQFRVRCSVYASGTATVSLCGAIDTVSPAANAGTAPGSTTLGAGEAHLGEVAGNLTGGAVETIRPANTTAYSANQTIASLTSSPIIDWTFPVGRKASGTGYIVKAKLLTNQAACVAHFRLHLYKATPTAIADGVACTVLYANDANYAGFIDFPACANNGSSSDDCAQAFVIPGVVGKLGAPSLPLSFRADASLNLYGLLETLDGFTPASGQKIRISLDCDDN